MLTIIYRKESNLSYTRISNNEKISEKQLDKIMK